MAVKLLHTELAISILHCDCPHHYPFNTHTPKISLYDWSSAIFYSELRSQCWKTLQSSKASFSSIQEKGSKSPFSALPFWSLQQSPELSDMKKQEIDPTEEGEGSGVKGKAMKVGVKGSTDQQGPAPCLSPASFLLSSLPMSLPPQTIKPVWLSKHS